MGAPMSKPPKPTITKTKGRDVAAGIIVECPQCHVEQPLPLKHRTAPRGTEGYEVDGRGIVSPWFVCMQVTCDFEGQIQIVGDDKR